ncbi:polysaccharide biosynthesis/export family protein [Siccirubricoccus deserti]
MVDPSGNLFLPNIGPIRIAGTRAGDLQRVVEAEVQRIYTSQVQVYAVLLSTQRIGVFVTGFVRTPAASAAARRTACSTTLCAPAVSTPAAAPTATSSCSAAAGPSPPSTSTASCWMEGCRPRGCRKATPSSSPASARWSGRMARCATTTCSRCLAG